MRSDGTQGDRSWRGGTRGEGTVGDGSERGDPDPFVSFVVPARNEEAYLPATLRSIAALETSVPYEVIVVDGESEDATTAIAREFGARLVEQEGRGIGPARHAGAAVATGEWLAFVDADTTVRPAYLDAMLAFVREGGYDAATSRCRVVGCRRAKLMEATINHVFSRLGRPVLPGFNFFVDSGVYAAAGGFPAVGNEDTAFSRRLGRRYRTGYCPEVVVETSARRIQRTGLTGTLLHYLRLDWQRVRAT